MYSSELPVPSVKTGGCCRIINASEQFWFLWINAFFSLTIDFCQDHASPYGTSSLYKSKHSHLHKQNKEMKFYNFYVVILYSAERSYWHCKMEQLTIFFLCKLLRCWTVKLGSILTTPHSSEACMVLLNGLELELSQNYELSRESSFIIETCNQP